MDELNETTEQADQTGLFEGDAEADRVAEERENEGDNEGADEVSTEVEAVPETLDAPTEETTSGEVTTEALDALAAKVAEAEATPVEATPAKLVTRTVPTTRHIRVELPHKEKSKLFDEVMDLDEQIKQTEKSKKHQAEKHKDKLDSLNAKRLELTDLGREGRKADVECDMTLDYTNEKVTVVRRDTGEVLESRTMTKDERQGTLEFGSTDRKVETVVDLAAAGVPVNAPTTEAAEPVEPPADEWVVRWFDKSNPETGGISQRLDGKGDLVFPSAFDAEEWCESQRPVYGETTEYVSQPRAIAVAAPVAEEVPVAAPVEWVVKVTHDDETFSYCVNEENAIARFPTEAAADTYAKEQHARMGANYSAEVYVPAPILADTDDENDNMGFMLVDDDVDATATEAKPKKRAKSTRKRKTNTKAKSAKAAQV